MRKALIILTLLIALLPTIASTNLGKKSVEYLLQKRLAHSLRFESLSLHWHKPQKATNLSTYTPTSPFTFTAREISLPSLSKTLLSPQKEIQLTGGALFFQNAPWAESIDGTLSYNKGELHFSLSSSITNGKVDGSVIQDTLTLNSPLEITTAIPLEKGNIPITLQIDSEGFSFPLAGRTLRELQAPKLRLTSAPITYKPAKALRLAFRLINKTPLKKKIILTIDPIDLSITNGVIHLPPTPIRYESVSVILKGTVDLHTENMDLLLEVPGDFLRALFGLEWLTADVALKIPLRGKIGELSIEEELYRFLMENL
ncbi:MAG: hypothetical protein KR126chlam1_01291 [Chlamydiae bacterium]|nr:hypothetical protein [Chlamydiota bacterium]